jgi:hypothetical protein
MVRAIRYLSAFSPYTSSPTPNDNGLPAAIASTYLLLIATTAVLVPPPTARSPIAPVPPVAPAPAPAAPLPAFAAAAVATHFQAIWPALQPPQTYGVNGHTRCRRPNQTKHISGAAFPDPCSHTKSAVGFFIIQILKALALIKADRIYPVSCYLYTRSGAHTQ